MWTHEKHVQQKLPNPNPKWIDWEKRKSEFIFWERTGEIEPDPPFVVCQSRSSCLAANCTISPNPLINSPFYFIFYNKVYIFIILWQILQSKSFKVLDIYIYIFFFWECKVPDLNGLLNQSNNNNNNNKQYKKLQDTTMV